MKADSRIRAIQIYRFYKRGCSTGLREDCIGGQQIIESLKKLMDQCDKEEFCERCFSVLTDGKCSNVECEHQLILNDIDEMP